MPTFAYQGIQKNGKKVKGTVDAESTRMARAKLRSQGIFTKSIQESNKGSQKNTNRGIDLAGLVGSKRVPLTRLAQETRQLSTLVGAGIPIVESLQVLAAQCDHAAFKSTTTAIREKIEDGASLAKAMADFPHVFPRLYINMVSSGEASGKLDLALENLADHFEAQLQLHRKIQSALFYPALMFIICVLVVLGLVTFVVPTIVEIFEKRKVQLPLPTRALIFISGILTNYWPIILSLCGLGLLGLGYAYRNPKGRERIDRFLLHVPLASNVYRKIYTARVASTLATLLSSGVQLLPALDIVKNIVGNVHVVRAIEEARDGVREGRSLAKEFSKTGLFPMLFCQMIGVGEKSGKIENMLEKASKSFKNEVEATITGLTTLIEPLMIISLGGLVLVIVVSVLLPMFEMMDAIQG